jgi:hypothetical protein
MLTDKCGHVRLALEARLVLEALIRDTRRITAAR